MKRIEAHRTIFARLLLCLLLVFITGFADNIPARSSVQREKFLEVSYDY